MKKIFTIAAALFITASVFAQAPDKMSYQGVIRDAGNVLVTNQSIGMQVSILQGSSSGTAVYVETQTPTSNINGLVSIEVGTGTVVSGTFNSIDWGTNGPYFIKTESDPTGGTSYTITGTSQLLSVPYALNANMLTGGIDLAYIQALEARIEALEPPKAVVGDFRDGGIVFWVDPSDSTHGLVCAINDHSSSVIWGCQGTSIVGADGSAIGTGAANTADIIAGCLTPGIAADVATNMTDGGYTDWFLPSRAELNEMYSHRVVINASATVNGGSDFMPTGFYWSSTESNGNTAWEVYFDTGANGGLNKGASANFFMRAVRAF